MQIRHCPPQFSYFHDLSLEEQTRIVLHARLLRSLADWTDLDPDSVPLARFRLLDLSDALLCARSEAPSEVHLWKLVLFLIQQDPKDQADLRVDSAFLDTTTVAESLVHSVILAMATGLPWREFLSGDHFHETVQFLMEDDTGYGSRVLGLKVALAQTAPKLETFLSTGALVSVGQAIESVARTLSVPEPQE